MLLRLLAPLALFGLFFTACTPEPQTRGASAARGTDQAANVSAAPLSPVGQAEAVIGKRFGDSGWIERIVVMEYLDGILRVTIDRNTGTLSQLDAYTHMCQALTSLIASEENPDGVAGVQFFRADGKPIVASTAPNSKCSRFTP